MNALSCSSLSLGLSQALHPRIIIVGILLAAMDDERVALLALEASLHAQQQRLPRRPPPSRQQCARLLMSIIVSVIVAVVGDCLDYIDCSSCISRPTCEWCTSASASVSNNQNGFCYAVPTAGGTTCSMYGQKKATYCSVTSADASTTYSSGGGNGDGSLTSAVATSQCATHCNTNRWSRRGRAANAQL
jgi:hypothetical protein